jgi:hypothetical protein
LNESVAERWCQVLDRGMVATAVSDAFDAGLNLADPQTTLFGSRPGGHLPSSS